MHWKLFIYLGLLGNITALEANALCVDIKTTDVFFTPGYSFYAGRGVYINALGRTFQFTNTKTDRDIRAFYVPQEDLVKLIVPDTQNLNSPSEDQLRMSSPYSIILEYTSETAPSGVLAQVHVTDKNVIDRCYLVDRLIQSEEGLQEKIRASVKGLKKFNTLQVYLREKPYPNGDRKSETLIPCGDKFADVTPVSVVVELDRKKVLMANGRKALDDTPSCRAQIQK